jgi:BMFP domain-containing protein YqiC
MQSENRLFDDFVKMVNGFAGTMAGMGREAEESAREKMREWVGGMDFVGARRVRGGKGDGRCRPRGE